MVAAMWTPPHRLLHGCMDWWVDGWMGGWLHGRMGWREDKTPKWRSVDKTGFSGEEIADRYDRFRSRAGTDPAEPRTDRFREDLPLLAVVHSKGYANICVHC